MTDPVVSAAGGTKASLSDRLTLISLHVGLFLLAEVLTWNWTHSLSALQDRGVKTSATVIYKGMTEGRSSHPFITYTYQTSSDGQRWSRTEAVYSDDYSQARIGEAVPIVFDPHVPRRARLVWHDEGPGGNYIVAFVLLSLVWFIIAAFSFGFMWLGATI